MHPGRSAKDGVAILVRKARLRIESHKTVELLGSVNTTGRGDVEPFDESVHGVHRMSALLVSARDVATGARVLLGCTHLYPKKCHLPHLTLLSALEAESGGEHAPSFVVWGGCCNHVYPVKPGANIRDVQGYITALGGGKTLHKWPDKQDWVFAKVTAGGGHLDVVRSAATRALVEATARPTAATGQPPSDHYAEAVCVRAAQETNETLL